MKIVYAVLTVLLSVLVLTPPASAQMQESYLVNKEKLRKDWEEKVRAIHQQLGLSAQQQKELEDNRSRYLAQKQALHEQIWDVKNKLNRQLQKDDLDLEQMRRLHEEIKDLKARKEDLRYRSILEVRQILSTEQFHEFMQLKEKLKTGK